MTALLGAFGIVAGYGVGVVFMQLWIDHAHLHRKGPSFGTEMQKYEEQIRRSLADMLSTTTEGVK